MSGESGRVLVVDDSAVIRQLIRVNLELEGFQVVTAADGAECLDVVHAVRPDVITLDVVMPRLDGLRTAARLRADPRTSHLRIAIVSACTQLDLERGESVGVDGYLAKPFEPMDLVALVRRLAEERRSEDHRREGHRTAERADAESAPAERAEHPDMGVAPAHAVGEGRHSVRSRRTL
ncbi:response regulator [Streptacidiphilus rugosus]|uniref:response regulator n=1 Tax=Streptacidiphilus rugosus TaxID=405783 RepID=UPI0009FBCE0C|nr:response regulator [Streptacidiphilus rugosus]